MSCDHVFLFLWAAWNLGNTFKTPLENIQNLEVHILCFILLFLASYLTPTYILTHINFNKHLQ